MPRKPKIEDVTRAFAVEHGVKATAEKEMAKLRKLFFDLIEIPETDLARQTIYVEAEDPEAYVAVMYPKWRIVNYKTVAAEDEPPEWKVIIQEDPTKKTFQYVNPIDKKVYQRTVAEGAPDIDMERLKVEDMILWNAVTFRPPEPERELKPLDELTEDEREALKNYLTPGKLTNRMEAPRDAKPEELEGLE
jgi:hypothetical protein